MPFEETHKKRVMSAAATTKSHDLFTIGAIKEFNPDHDEWPLYIELLGHYFAANAIASEHRQRSILLSLVGLRSYRALCSAIYPDKPGDRTYDQLCQLLATHFAPVIIYHERAQFYAAIKGDAESVAEYYGRLQRLAGKCGFDESSKDRTVLDRFVTGLMNCERIFERLCLEDAATLSLDRAVALAVQVEQEQKLKSRRVGTVRQQHHVNRRHEGLNRVIRELRTNNRSDCCFGAPITSTKWKSECSLLAAAKCNNDLTKGSIKVCNFCAAAVTSPSKHATITAELKAKNCDRLKHAYSINKEKIDSLKLNYVSVVVSASNWIRNNLN